MNYTYEDDGFRITHDLSPGSKSFIIESASGSLLSHSTPDNSLYINMVKARIPRQKVGKALLEQSIIEARKLGHESIGAKILTRECLASMQHVFGDDSIIIVKIGDWVKERGSTKAYLDYRVPPNLPILE